MALEFPTPLQLLERYVGIRSDVGTPEGRLGYRQIMNDIRDLAQKWSLGDVTIHEFDNGIPLASGEPRPANITIDVGEGEEMGLWYAHADVIQATEGMYPPSINPYQLHKKPNKGEGVYGGCGSLDMKTGMVAELCALHGIDDVLQKTNRRIRVLFVYDEEGNSDGMHHARHLIRDADWAISTEIKVGSKLGQNGELLYARPGRVRYHVVIKALETAHLGMAKSITRKNRVQSRVFRAATAIEALKLPEQYKNLDPLMPDSYCLAHTFGIYEPPSFSTADTGYINIEVFYTNPKLALVDIEAAIRGRLQEVLKKEFTIELFKRSTPFIRPWYDKPDEVLVQTGLHELSKLSPNAPKLQWGLPVAEEGKFTDERVPIITLTPDGEGEHTGEECVSVLYTENVMIPFLRNMAATQQPLAKT